MTKYVISNVELIKKDYLVEAYTKEAAQEKAHLQPPRTKISLGEITHSVTPINEYEYNKDWKPGLADKIDWKPQPDYNEGYDLIKSLDPDLGPDQLKDQNDWVGEIEGVKISEGKGTLLDPDRLKGPTLNVIEDDSYDLYRDD